MRKVLVALALSAMASGAFAQTVFVGISGLDSVNALGDSLNVVLLVDLGVADAEVTSIEWDLGFTPFLPSWTAEPNMQFSDSSQARTYNWDMGDWGGVNDSNPINLAGSESTSFFVGADGMLRIELWEDFVDFSGADGFYDQGVLTINFVPAPSSLSIARSRRNAGNASPSLSTVHDLV